MKSDGSLFYELGQYGPLLLIFLSMFLLWDTPKLFFFYMTGLFANSITTLLLKGSIQQPRPCFNTKEFQLALKNNKMYMFKDGIPFDIFGMPSGHTSSVIFSAVFVYLSLKKTKWLYVFVPFSLLVMAQRVSYKYHTVPQVLAGAVVGTLVAFCAYNFAEKNLKGSIREKPDDYAPI